MKTSTVDGRASSANVYFFLQVTIRIAFRASLFEIAPDFEAGFNTNAPVAALRPIMAGALLAGLEAMDSDRVAMAPICSPRHGHARSSAGQAIAFQDVTGKPMPSRLRLPPA